jgi:hypothetical protein
MFIYIYIYMHACFCPGVFQAGMRVYRSIRTQPCVSFINHTHSCIFDQERAIAGSHLVSMPCSSSPLEKRAYKCCFFPSKCQEMSVCMRTKKGRSRKRRQNKAQLYQTMNQLCSIGTYTEKRLVSRHTNKERETGGGSACVCRLITHNPE